jgi:hypothetical protein
MNEDMLISKKKKMERDEEGRLFTLCNTVSSLVITDQQIDFPCTVSDGRLTVLQLQAGA